MAFHTQTPRALAALIGLLWPALSCAQGGRMPETTITLRPQQVRGPISPLIYGTNHRYNNNATGTWDAARNRMVPAFDRFHREDGLKSIRYPGGTVASTFEWKHAIGPVKSRRPIQPAQGTKSNAKGGGPQVATWGVGEAARWCEANDVELVYMYGIGALNVPADAKRLTLPKLNAEASNAADGSVYLMVINQDATDNVAASIQIEGFGAGGAVEMWTLNGPSATAANTPQNPQAVKITPSRAAFQGGTLRHVFPAHSLTAIKFPAG